MREAELIVYRTLQDGALLHDMAWLMSHYMEADSVRMNVAGAMDAVEMTGAMNGVGTAGHCALAGRSCSLEKMRRLFYDCIHKLKELAGTYGFHENLWHCYLANL